jgi:hypothetical protein
MWQIGEAWIDAGRREYGTGKALAEEIGIPYKTCQAAALVVKRFNKLYGPNCLAARQSEPEAETPNLESKPEPKPKPQVSFDAFNTAATLNDESADELRDAYKRDATL